MNGERVPLPGFVISQKAQASRLSAHSMRGSAGRAANRWPTNFLLRFLDP
jgi:hypothetical protein